MLEWVKAHPALTAVGVFAVGVVVVLMFSGGSAAPGDGGAAAALAAAQANEAATGNQLASDQQQLQAYTNSTQAGVAIDANDTASAVQLAQIAANEKSHEADVAAQAAAVTAGFQSHAVEVQSTLAAQVNASNNSTSIMQGILNSLAASLQTPAAGSVLQQAGTVIGANVHGTFNLGGAPSSFDITSTPNITNDIGHPNFITDPYGNVYASSVSGNPNGTPIPGNAIYEGTVAGGPARYYVPVQPPSVTH